MKILSPYRQRIDALDDKIIDLLAERFDIIREVGPLKYKEGIHAVLQDRVDEVRERNAERAARKNVDPDLVRTLYHQIIAASCTMEEEIMAALSQNEKAAK